MNLLWYLILLNIWYKSTKIHFNNQELIVFLYFCSGYGEAEDRIHRCDARIHDDSRGVFAYLSFLSG